MSEPITLEWLNATLEKKFAVKEGVFQNDWWHCGWRFDNGLGTTIVRVLDVGNGEFMAEIAQSTDGADVPWSSGVGLLVKTQEDLRKLCEGVKIKGRLTGA